MLRYVIRRLLWVVVLLFAISILTFAMFFLLPGDPAAQAVPKGATPETLALIRHRMGLDLPVWKQYLNFLHGPDLVGSGHPSGVLNWPPNLGWSFRNQEPVLNTILDRLPVTASLTIGAAFFWLLIGIPIGVLAALHPRSLRDRAAMGFALFGVSMPVFLVGIGLLYIFYFKLGWAPAPKYVSFTQNPLQWANQLLLAWITIAVGTAALYTRMVRGNMLEVMGEDYVRTARAKGLSERRVTVKHILRSSLTPVVTMLGLDIGVLLGGAIITERVFGLPGIGATTIDAIVGNDLPVIQGVVLFAAFFVVTFNLIVDIFYAVLDPRVRYS
ncbi:MAG TPA: ABC transporter permease [Actinomycetota bacterium]|jgi:peptide/nickel transport system permease protein